MRNALRHTKLWDRTLTVVYYKCHGGAGGGGRIVDLVEIGGCSRVYWTRGKWWWMIDGGVVGGGKVRVDAGVCRCWSCRYLFLHRGSFYMEKRKEKRRSRGRESVREDYMTSSYGQWLTGINSLETSLM